MPSYAHISPSWGRISNVASRKYLHGIRTAGIFATELELLRQLVLELGVPPTNSLLVFLLPLEESMSHEDGGGGGGGCEQSGLRY